MSPDNLKNEGGIHNHTHTHTHNQKLLTKFFYFFKEAIKMKIAFFSVIKKSFLTLAIFILFLSNISSLIYADDTLFSIEGMNMNSSIS
jgi:hypothetical protein